MTLVSLGLAVVAGILSTLSPCVLPLLPVIIGSAAAEHRYAPVALAGGLALSFAAIGLLIATFGYAIGLDADILRKTAAILLFAIGIVLLVPVLQERVAVAAGPVGSWVGNTLGPSQATGLAGQFGVGLLLGAVWTPCAGPTLGAASVLASQGQNLFDVAATMLLFGLGAALPLLVLGTLSREAMLKLRGSVGKASGIIRSGLGALLVVLAVMILSGLDKRLETWLLDMSPEWLTVLTTSI